MKPSITDMNLSAETGESHLGWCVHLPPSGPAIICTAWVQASNCSLCSQHFIDTISSNNIFISHLIAQTKIGFNSASLHICVYIFDPTFPISISDFLFPICSCVCFISYCFFHLPNYALYIISCISLFLLSLFLILFHLLLLFTHFYFSVVIVISAYICMYVCA